MEPYPSYRYPTRPLLQLAARALIGKPYSFRALAEQFAAGMSGLKVLGGIPSLENGIRGYIFTPNHYCRPGFGAWWIALAVSARVPFDIHWVMAAQWRDLRPVRRWTVTPASRAIFPRIARTLDFTCFPPMPPAPEDQENRALAVRALVRYAREAAHPAVGFAPEGMDSPSGCLMLPHSGVGRLLAHLGSLGLAIQPVGVFEEGECLVLNFGQPYRLNLDGAVSSKEIDDRVGWRVMREIAALLPEPMRRMVPPHD